MTRDKPRSCNPAVESMNSNLDTSQREAVCCGTGPCEIIAGPGSGKTTVLTERILYLLDHYHLEPSKIIVMTFSRSAAAEMKERFLQKAGDRCRGVRFGTFHSVFYHILRESSPRNYSILRQSDKEELLGRLIRAYYPDESERPSVEEIEKFLHKGGIPGADEGKREAVRRDYNAFLKENGYLDFDAMVSECRKLLLGDDKLRSYWRKQFRAVLVDEFQDVNREQYETLRLLTDGEGLFVVGDDDQSIYGFRGSSPAIMRQFMEDYPGARRIFLSRNYRCSGSVCRTSDLLIRRNKDRIAKNMLAVRPMGDKTVLRGFKDDEEEYRYLAGSLGALSPGELSHTAVILRTNTHVIRAVNYLSAHGIMCSGWSKPGQDLIRTLTGDIEAYYILAKSIGEDRLPRRRLFRVMNRPERYLLRSAANEEYMQPAALLAWAGRNGGSITELGEFLRDLQILSGLNPEGFIRYLFQSVGYGQWAVDHLGERETVKAALEDILRRSRSETDTEALIRKLRQDTEGDRKKSCEDGVRIMTMHVCKGLEFDRVYLPSLNEGIIPGRRCRKPSDFEEERRLLYVAMTRAREHLELLYIRGTRENPRPPSRFLSVYGVRSFV